MKRALFLGRFQPFHLGHLGVVKQILKENDEVIIAIGSAQYSGTKENPFSFKQRKEMIEKTLEAEGITNFVVIRVDDIHNDDKYVVHVEKLAPKFDLVYIGNKKTADLFEKKGHQIIKLRRIKWISSTKIREKMRNGEKWDNLVPKEVYTYMTKYNKKK